MTKTIDSSTQLVRRARLARALVVDMAAGPRLAEVVPEIIRQDSRAFTAGRHRQ